MADVLYLSELPADSELRILPKHAIGDRVRIVGVKIGDINNYPEDTQAAFKAVTGRVLSIKEIEFWETDQPAYQPYYITYEFYVAHLTGSPNRRSYEETLFLTDDEFVAVKKRKKNKNL